MKKTRQCLTLTIAAALLLSACAQGGGNSSSASQETAVTLQAAQSAYLEKVDIDYSYDLALRMEEIRSNDALGYRTAGSEAELATGDMLKAEMVERLIIAAQFSVFACNGREFLYIATL